MKMTAITVQVHVDIRTTTLERLKRPGIAVFVSISDTVLMQNNISECGKIHIDICRVIYGSCYVWAMFLFGMREKLLKY